MSLISDPEPYAWMRNFGGGLNQAYQISGQMPLWGQKQMANQQGGQGSYSQSGQTYNTPQWASTMQGMTPYSPFGQVQGAGTYGLPASLPTDQTFMQNYGWPASLQGQGAVFNQQAAAQNAANQMALAKMQPQLAGETTAANMGEHQKVASQMGWTTPTEASPSLMGEIKKALGSSLQTTQNSAARSGRPISSTTENVQNNTIQAAIEAMVRAFSGARQTQQAGLMSFMK